MYFYFLEHLLLTTLIVATELDFDDCAEVQWHTYQIAWQNTDVQRYNYYMSAGYYRLLVQRVLEHVLPVMQPASFVTSRYQYVLQLLACLTHYHRAS